MNPDPSAALYITSISNGFLVSDVSLTSLPTYFSSISDLLEYIRARLEATSILDRLSNELDG